MPVYLTADTIKTWFVSRAKPLATQFAQWIDACWLKGQRIPAADIEGLDVYLGATVAPVAFEFTGVAEVFIIPDGYATYRIYGKNNEGASSFNIGSLSDAVAYLDETELTTAKQAYDVTIIADGADNQIVFYVNDVSDGTTCSFTIYLQKI